MRCLITGGAGFIGSHLTDRLRSEHHDVVILDNFTRSAITPAVCERRDIQVIQGDVREAAVVANAMRRVDVVFHLAAMSQVLGADRDPEYCFSTNVLGTLNVLQAARSASVRRVVFASSREVYGEPVHLPVSELQPLSPKNVYGASKVAAEAYCRTLGNADRLSTVVLRLANVYGPGDSGRLVPIWLQRAREGLDLDVFGGHQILDMVWIDTVVHACVAAVRPDVQASAINVGNGIGSRIGDIAGRILDATRSSSRIVVRPARKTEVQRFVADVRRMTCTLGIVPQQDPLEGIDHMANAHAPKVVLALAGSI